MTAEVLNPVEVENGIREASNNIARGVSICNERYKAFLKANHAYDLAFARAYLRHQGTQMEKKYSAELATEEERAAKDEADAAYKYAVNRAKALDKELGSLQSINKSVIGMYGAAGRGEY